MATPSGSSPRLESVSRWCELGLFSFPFPHCLSDCFLPTIHLRRPRPGPSREFRNGPRPDDASRRCLAVGCRGDRVRMGGTGRGDRPAQDEVRNFDKTPILMVETGGHHAPVRSLVWLDPFNLFSGGEDKVVKVWDFQAGGRLSRSIRPVIWRGPRGAIYAMAVSSKPDGQGQLLLAVGGYGVETAGGDLTIFRIPGLVRNPSGEVVKRLVRPPGNNPQAYGHSDTVSGLAFNRDSTILASASRDQTVILWDVTRDFAPIRVLRRHTGPIRALAFSPDGKRLATVGAEGLVVLWDVAQGQPAAFLETRVQTNTVAYSPDGAFIVVGNERGVVMGLDTTNLGGGNRLRIRPADQKPVEVVAYHPNGRLLAVSVKSDAVPVPDPMTIACDIELRSMPDGNLVPQPPRRVHGLVRAMAFSPDGDRLAYAGGSAQSIYIQDTTALRTPPRRSTGRGPPPSISASLRTARSSASPGSRSGRPTLPRFTRGLICRGGTPGLCVATVSPARSQPIRAGRSGRVSTRFGLEAVNANGGRILLAIDPSTERWWWSSTFVPPGPTHPRATVAIGTESGIAVFDLETGQRTRTFAGPSAPVVSVAPSPDGRWLVSGSQDQSVMLYPLAGCDTRPGLGAAFRQGADGTWTVESVQAKSFAKAMGLKRRDVITQAVIGSQLFARPEEIARFISQADQEPPGVKNPIGIQVRRRVSIPWFGPIPLEARLPTTKRDSPALTFLLDTDREWVVWTPGGYYDTSIAGDTRLLGWHTNPPYLASRSTDFVPIVTYSGTMNRPDVLDRLWRTGDLDQALAPMPAATPPPVAVAAASQPPRIRFASIGGNAQLPAPGVVWKVNVPRPRLTVTIAADAGKAEIRDRRIIVDERLRVQAPIAAPVTNLSEDIEIDLAPNRQVRLAVEAANVNGTRRTEILDMVYVQPPRPPVTIPRLHVLSIGTNQVADKQLPPVRFADKDAADLAQFLADHLTSTDGSRMKLEGRQVLTHADASSASIFAALDRLDGLLKKKMVNKGDVVAVVIAAHVLELQDSTIIAVSDSQFGQSPRSVVPARDLCELLGQLTDYGCRVVVFLDGVHKVDDSLVSEIKPLVRELYLKRRVITFVASKEGPSDVDVPNGHGLFALGVLRAFQGANPNGNRADAYTLDQFKTSLRDTVENLSGRQQDSSCYIPLEVPEQALFATP